MSNAHWTSRVQPSLVQPQKPCRRSVEALWIFPLVGGLPGADRAQPEEAALRPASPCTSRATAAGSGARNSARSIRRSACRRWRSRPARCCCSRSRSSNISTRSHPEPAAAAGRRDRARAGARRGADHRLRHPSAEQSGGAELPEGPLDTRPGRGRRMVPPLGDRRASTRSKRCSGPAPMRSARMSDTRRLCLVPQVFNARRFKVDVAKYPEDRRRRGGLPEASRLRQGAAGKPAGRRIARIARRSLPSRAARVTPSRAPRANLQHRPAVVLWMIGTLLSFSLMAISVRQLGGRCQPVRAADGAHRRRAR